jgi:predicted  nucleic acid-binding Zn-ribbon protein
MADTLEMLKKLQAVDSELYRLRRQQEEKPRELEAAAARVAAQEAKVKAAEAKLKAQQLAQKEKEVELQTKEASVKKLQGQLFQVKTNKEYSAMQHEIDALKADNSLLEEAILRAFDAIDQAAKERQAEQQQLAEEQQRLAKERARIEQEVAALNERVAQLERSRQALLPDVDPKAVKAYERILDIRDGLAMVPLLNDTCGGCNRRLPPQVVNQVYLKADLITCESCNRILYFDETHSKL